MVNCTNPETCKKHNHNYPQKAMSTGHTGFVDSFPDKTRAKTVHRYTPPLTFAELEILEACCAVFVDFKGQQARLAGGLVSRGLLESAHGWRVTSNGADVLQLWKNAGFKL